MKDHFNGHIEQSGPPTEVTAEEQLQREISDEAWLEAGNKEGSDGDQSKIHGVKKQSILHDLPYWKVLTSSFPF